LGEVRFFAQETHFQIFLVENFFFKSTLCDFFSLNYLKYIQLDIGIGLKNDDVFIFWKIRVVKKLVSLQIFLNEVLNYDINDF